MQDRVIKHFLKDESLLISDFDSFMPLGNELLPFDKSQDFTDSLNPDFTGTHGITSQHQPSQQVFT